uniref:Uncharacterized protein n=1 Tax=Arundo donax TaxID=35708 RepID=A0A0A8YLJ4_ARUDO
MAQHTLEQIEVGSCCCYVFKDVQHGSLHSWANDEIMRSEAFNFRNN